MKSEVLRYFENEILKFISILIKMTYPSENLDGILEELPSKVVQFEEFLELNPEKIVVLFLLAKTDLILLISLKGSEIYLSSVIIRYAEEGELTYTERAYSLYEFFEEEIGPKLNSEIVLSTMILVEDHLTIKTVNGLPDYRW